MITIFTPTYNRAYCLHNCYESLLRQTCKEFSWLIIDDGSLDNTEKLVSCWMEQQQEFEIRYIYKENGGLHTGYNEAIKNIETELCVCIDSDDSMPDDAVELILQKWKQEGSEKVAGILGLDCDPEGQSIGGRFADVDVMFWRDLKFKHKHYGDVKMVHRTELLKPYVPMHSYGNEKNFNPIYIFMKVDRDLPLLVLNKNICIVDYQEDGMTANIFNQYYNSPNSFAELRREMMVLPEAPISFQFRQCIHYISSCILAKQKNVIISSPKKLLTLLAIPFGVILSFYIKKQCRTSK